MLAKWDDPPSITGKPQVENKKTLKSVVSLCGKLYFWCTCSRPRFMENFMGHFIITNPNNALLYGKSLKTTIDLSCLIHQKKGSLMTPEFHGKFSSPKNPSSSTIAAPKIWRPTRPSTNKHLNVDDVSGPWKSWDFLFGLGQSWDYINGKFQPWINMHIIPIWVFHCHVSFQGCTGFFWRNFTRRNIS